MNSGANAPDAASSQRFTPAFVQELESLFAWRRDVRHFLTDPIAEPLIDRVVDAAGTAPSVGLSEPWRFVRVDSDAGRAAVIDNFDRANQDALAGQADDNAAQYASLKLAGLREAPVHIAVFCDEATMQGKGLGTATMPEMRRYSVVCAVMQMWLAARALGLGMGWVSILDPIRLAEDLDVPPDWSLIAYLCLGWPKEDHLDPELERMGWECRNRTAGRILRR